MPPVAERATHIGLGRGVDHLPTSNCRMNVYQNCNDSDYIRRKWRNSNLSCSAVDDTSDQYFLSRLDGHELDSIRSTSIPLLPKKARTKPTTAGIPEGLSNSYEPWKKLEQVQHTTHRPSTLFFDLGDRSYTRNGTPGCWLIWVEYDKVSYRHPNQYWFRTTTLLDKLRLYDLVLDLFSTLFIREWGPVRIKYKMYTRPRVYIIDFEAAIRFSEDDR
ncbi:hypothetical protein F5146DRAFT_994345 [Armillaria mellea]|nr:hypothetical protein F5146DRAFT_994345 [Armillaria mellea]